MNQIWLAFLAGLTTGGISCLAVQGGLLTSSVSSIEQTSQSSSDSYGRVKYIGMFLMAKLVAYTVLGFLLGLLGSSLTLSPRMLGVMQIGAGLFMFATALRLLDVHPIFRYAVIQSPRWSYRLLRRTSKDAKWFSPAILGFFTIVMPCGVTQAMMAIAVASANPLMGAAIMSAFVLGTSPLFFTLGATVMGLLTNKRFAFVAAGIIGLFAVLSINGGIALQGSPYTIQNFWKAATTRTDELRLTDSSAGTVSIKDGIQQVTVQVRNNGYAPSTTALKVGVPVKMTLITDNTRGCSRAFTIPEYGISKVLPASGSETVEFTPKKTGNLLITCSMGMYTQNFTVTL